MSDTESFESVYERLHPQLHNPCGLWKAATIAEWLDDLKRAHDREIRDTAQREFARGFNDGEHSMDAEHRAIAMRLRGLRFDGGSHENLSQIARAVYHADFGWTQGACAALRDELVRLMGGVSDESVHVGGLRCDDGCVGDVSNGEDTGRTHDSPSNRDRNHMAVREGVDTVIGDSDDTCCGAGGGACAADDCDCAGEQKEVEHGGAADDCGGDTGGSYRGMSIHLDGLTAYDVLWNERRKAIANLREWEPYKAFANDKCGELQIRLLYQLLGLGGAMMMDGADAAKEVRDRLIHLLGGNQPSGIDAMGSYEQRIEKLMEQRDELRDERDELRAKLAIIREAIDG